MDGLEGNIRGITAVKPRKLTLYALMECTVSRPIRLRVVLLLVLGLAAVQYRLGSEIYQRLIDSTPRMYRLVPRYLRLQGNAVYCSSYEYLKGTTELYAQKNITRNNKTSFKSRKKAVYKRISSSTMYGTKKPITAEEVLRKTESPLPLCAQTPPDLGPISVNRSVLELDFLKKKYPELKLGGQYSPPNCTALHKVAIIVPFRDRQQHLAVFLNHMHPFLMKQQIEYRIFVVEQADNNDFNRAKLMNVGFVESLRLVSGWGCFIFHDIDMLPEDSRNLYSCPSRQPRHMSANFERQNYKIPYETYFGGVTALTLEQFIQVNGFSNKYWGWGGEDDDMSTRLMLADYRIGRYAMSISRYATLHHNRSMPNPLRYHLLWETKDKYLTDGLSSLEYHIEKVVQEYLYTHILVDISCGFTSLSSCLAVISSTVPMYIYVTGKSI